MENPAPEGKTSRENLVDLNQGQDLPPKFYEHATLLVLFYDRWFRFAAILFLLALISVGLLLPKIWRVTPGYMPIVRVSGLDVLQANSLRSAALKQSAAGQVKDALLSWRSAIDNNPGNADVIREMVDYIVKQPTVPVEYAGYAANRSIWLLALSQTNKQDVALVAELFSHIQEDGFAIHLAESVAHELPGAALVSLAKSEFREGRMEKFDEIWKLNAPELSKDPEASMYRLAWEAGWGPSATMIHGQMELQHALNSTNTAQAAIAHRLYLFVCLNSQDVVNYRRSFDWLIEHHADMVPDHINYWRLLIGLGDKTEATRQVKAFSRPPGNTQDVMGISSIMANLGLVEDAVDFLQKQSASFGYSTDVWLQLADLRISQKRWTELYSQGVSMRRDEQLDGRLDGFSYYVEGMAHYGSGRLEAASKAFKSAASSRFDQQLPLAFACARGMRKAGYSAEAEDLLRRVQKNYAQQAEFWFELSLAAYASHDMETLSKATERAYQLEPDKTGYMNNYAAILIAQRRNPEESVKLTNRLLAALPDNPELKINHALALLQLERFTEAEKLLKSVNPSRLQASEASVANYAWAELQLAKKDVSGARKSYSLVNTNHLMPPQITWMESQLKKI